MGLSEGRKCQTANLKQYVNERIHKHGKILDFVMSGEDDNLVTCLFCVFHAV